MKLRLPCIVIRKRQRMGTEAMYRGWHPVFGWFTMVLDDEQPLTEGELADVAELERIHNLQVPEPVETPSNGGAEQV